MFYEEIKNISPDKFKRLAGVKKGVFALMLNSLAPYKKHIGSIVAEIDTGYQGILKIKTNVQIPKRRGKKNPLIREDKKNNKTIASSRSL